LLSFGCAKAGLLAITAVGYGRGAGTKEAFPLAVMISPEIDDWGDKPMMIG
jgi:hypothetical protein